MRAAMLVLTMSLATVALRFLPFVVFRNRTPKYVTYLGRVLPPAIIGMLVIYCLKDLNPLVRPFGLPELLASACVVGMQVWRRNSLVSILSGTVIYMALVQLVVG